MNLTDFDRGTITLRHKEIPVSTGFLRHIELRYYPENPRVYSVVCTDEKEPAQKDIEKALQHMDHVKQLVQSIRANDGLIDPLLVRMGDLTVLEGNSRLAAIRLLDQKDPIKWGKVKVRLLPKNISHSDIFALLGEYHIVGKKDWVPYEQAAYLYRRSTKDGVTPQAMAGELGMSATKVRKLIHVYEFMVQHNENNIGRWSYYEEYLKHRDIKKARKKFPKLDSLVVKKIKDREIPRAVDIRDKLLTITKSSKTCKDFVAGKRDFDGAYESAISRGSGDTCYSRLNKFRGWLVGEKVKENIGNMSGEVRKKCLFEIKRIKKHCEKILQDLTEKK